MIVGLHCIGVAHKKQIITTCTTIMPFKCEKLRFEASAPSYHKSHTAILHHQRHWRADPEICTTNKKDSAVNFKNISRRSWSREDGLRQGVGRVETLTTLFTWGGVITSFPCEHWNSNISSAIFPTCPLMTHNSYNNQPH